ncbi:MAG: hypothetical protein IT314_08235 [Anaerolineales bacterium]|nr:hypothetical protein [Anaerolineales bacterium]
MAEKKDERGKKRREVKIEFVVSPVPQEPEKQISEAQEIQLDIIAKTNFNLFRGRDIAAWLRRNHKMWRAVLLPLDFISLRDMDDGHWHADTLYIYPEAGWGFELEEIMREQFQADETSWIGGETAAEMLADSEVEDKSYVLLEIWWD